MPVDLRPRVAEILSVTEEACGALLDDECARLCTALVARLSRKRPSPLARGDTRIWAAGSIYALGRVNFLFDRSQQPHVSADQLAAQLGVAKTTMANKAALILKALEVGAFEPADRAAPARRHASGARQESSRRSTSSRTSSRASPRSRPDIRSWS